MTMFRSFCVLIALMLTMSGQDADALKAPSLLPVEVASFAKRVFREMGENNDNITATAETYQAEFDAANEQTQGQFSDELRNLFEIRAIDLELSLHRTREMQRLIAQLVGTNLQNS